MIRRPQFKFRLYVADDTLNSSQALANLTSFCERYLAGRHQIEVVDVFRHPERALSDRIFMTPTLIKLVPRPIRMIVGTLSDEQPVIRLLGLVGADA
jgi:circadian clock protein KaiB